ncbi:hypothetical protein [Rhizobium sp. TRM95796]|uniref:hypothetical protein n=1 Tax=Rhizobium sp. TRM95796 TaxID=2979862 RepID=UPI0021E81BA5|nr:hypothetical protein [Rhizobium sp. TRM95796]MCV3765402.1 hypothetical protein [Rhizobium sp. TRM95796]
MAEDSEDHLGEADGQGRIRLDSQEAPAAYQVRAIRSEGDDYNILVSVMASRDWLLDNGFVKSVDLIRQNGREAAMYFDGALDVGDNIAVRLTCEEGFSGSEDQFLSVYPEFVASVKPGVA